MGEVISLIKLAEKRKHWRRKTVVFTNGVFDLIHYGHLKLLQDCKNFGDILIVGMNTDSSVKGFKSKGRPITPYSDRSELIASLSPVDYVVSFSQLTPINLILRLKPDVLVKGSDYKVNEIVGAKEVKSWGGKVKRVKLLKGRSTSQIISKIIRLTQT